MSRILRIVAIVAAIYLLLALLDELVLVRLLITRLGVPLLLAVFSALAAVGAGFIARGLRGRIWRFDNPDTRPDLPVDFLIGVPLFGTVCFLAGMIHVSTWTMDPLLLLFGLAGAYAIARHFETRTRTAAGATPFQGLALAAIVIVFAAAFVAAQAAPSSLDELAYHLAVPWTWVKEARAIELPLLSHSYFPLGVESADLPALTILGNVDGGLASHLFHLLVAIAATVVIARRSRNLLLTAGIVATPALAVASGWSLVDWHLTGLAVILAGAVDDEDHATLAAALGAGLLTKYTFAPLALLVVIAGFRRGVASRWKPLAIGLAVGCVFFVRNLVLTGNPVAPFLSATAPHVAGYRTPAYLSTYVFDGHFIDESLGATLLALAIATTGAVGWVLLAAGLALFFLAPSARIVVPFLALAAARGRALAESRVLRAVIAVAVVAQLLLVVFLTERSDAFSLIAARLSDEQYLDKARPSVMVIRALDASLPPDSCTLIIGLNETYWFAHRVRGGGNFDGPRLSHYLEAPTAEALHARLRADGITHVAVMNIPPPTNVVKKLEERDTQLTPAAQRALALTLDHYATNVTAPGSSATLFALH